MIRKSNLEALIVLCIHGVCIQGKTVLSKSKETLIPENSRLCLDRSNLSVMICFSVHCVHIKDKAVDGSVPDRVLEEEALHSGRSHCLEPRQQQQESAEAGWLAGQARADVIT